MYAKYKVHITLEGTRVYVYTKGNFTYYLKRYIHVDTECKKEAFYTHKVTQL